MSISSIPPSPFSFIESFTDEGVLQDLMADGLTVPAQSSSRKRLRDESETSLATSDEVAAIPLELMAAPLAPSAQSPSHKRPKGEPEAGTDDALDLALDAPAAGTYAAFDRVFNEAFDGQTNTVSNAKKIFENLFAEADQIEAPQERDEAFSAMADYLCKNISLKNKSVRGIWWRAIEASTQSKTTLYFVDNLLQGVSAIRSWDSDLANKLIKKGVSYVQQNTCAPQSRIQKLEAIIAAGQEMGCIYRRTELSAQRSIRVLQARVPGPFNPYRTLRFPVPPVPEID